MAPTSTLEITDSISEELNYSKEQESSKEEKKSILVNRGFDTPMPATIKRESSKATIQWKGVQEKLFNEQMKMHRSTSLPSLHMLLTKGSRWNLIYDIMTKFHSKELKTEPEDTTQSHGIADKGVMSVVWDFGVGILQQRQKQDKGVELSLQQQVQLEILKQKRRLEIKHYLAKHPELDILLSLVYRALFKTQPKDPKLFVANYVHHLNTHREEMVLEEISVSFDPPSSPEPELSELEKENLKTTEFIKHLLERCAYSASLGAAYVNVVSVLESILQTMSPSEEYILMASYRKTASDVVSEMLEKVLREVILSKTRSAELIVNVILESFLERVLPSTRTESEIYVDARESLERFIKTLLKSRVTDKLMANIKSKGMKVKQSRGTNEDNLILEKTPTKSILKIAEAKSVQSEYNESRVKFRSFKPEPDD